MKRSKPLKRKKPMKRTGFKKKEYLWGGRQSKGRLIIVEPRKRIRPRSKKREKLDREYARLRKKFLDENVVCGVFRCWKPATQIHHKARRGKFYLRTDTWMAVCAKHHDKIEKEGDWAKAMGYTLTPEQRRLLG